MDIILIPILVAAAIGLVIGFIKGFTKIKSWANDLVLTTVCVVAIMNKIGALIPEWLQKLGVEGGAMGMQPEQLTAIAQFAVTLLLTIAFIMLFAFISKRAKKFFEKGIANRKLKSYYKQMEERDETEEEMVAALEEKDERTFKKLAKNEFKESSGAIGIFNRVWGALTLALKGAVIAFIAISAVYVIIDLLNVSFDINVNNGTNTNIIHVLLNETTWLTLKPYVFDLLTVALIMLCLRCGFKAGLFGALWPIVQVALVILAGYVAWHLAFNDTAFVQLGYNLSNAIGDKLTAITQYTEGFGLTAEVLCQSIITLGLFIIELIPIILLGVFVPKLLANARDSKIFKSIDGSLGAIVSLVLVLGVILAIGSVFNSINDLEIMQDFNTYFERSQISNVFYLDNVINFFVKINIRDWLIS
ncbi:MAG: hypothetical protein J6B04_04695 [Clostridia bacterium]|nr:hypothetical protein [Clostridia bacterium]